MSEATARLWNRANYQRRQAVFHHTKRPSYAFQCECFKDDPDFKLLGTCKAQALLHKLDEAWKATYSLLKLKKSGGLPQNIKKIGLPHYWKDRKTNKLEPRGIFVRNDGCWLDDHVVSISNEIKIAYTSGALWIGKQGRLEIQRHNNNRWYAHQPIELPKRKILESSEPRRITAPIDLGVCNLITARIKYQSVIYSGRALLSDWTYYTKKIAAIQSRLNRINNRHTSKKLKTLFGKRKQHFKHAMNAMLRDLFERLEEAGVTELVIGDLTQIREAANYSRKVNQKIHNYWSFKQITSRIEELGEEYEIKITPVSEAYSSQRCSLCEGHPIHPNARIYRGLYYCPVKHSYINADVNGSRNIADASPHREKKELAVAGSMAEPLLLRWDRCGWKSKSSMIIQDRENTIEAQTTKIPILVEIQE
ncbi:MAG: transposase [Thaumarchaeota archaeon]|nr:transposase [Nitrososphaerota archaeon]MDG6995509.1 transposase [Nitrososphaerota archaeon]